MRGKLHLSRFYSFFDIKRNDDVPFATQWAVLAGVARAASNRVCVPLRASIHFTLQAHPGPRYRRRKRT